MNDDATPRSRARAIADRMRDLPDSSIDTSDIPVLGDDFFATAALLMPAGKSEVSLRVDNDVLAFFRTGGKGYQSRINAVLRAYMIGARQRVGSRLDPGSRHRTRGPKGG
jgi:uncharacterized protein (DUF4415 family)